MRVKDKKYIFCFIIILAVITLTAGFSSFTNTNLLKDISAIFRIQKEIRITNFFVSNVNNSGESVYYEYNYDNVSAGIRLPNQNSTVTYKVVVTNLGDFVGQIESITGLPSNITYELSGLDIDENICDNYDRCRNGIVKEFFITFKYVTNGYDSSNPNGEYDINAIFDFSKNYLVTYYANVFYANPSISSSGLTIDYDPVTNEMTINGTQSDEVVLMNLLDMTFIEGEKYKIELEYISGSHTSSGMNSFSTYISPQSQTFTSTPNWKDVNIPDSGSEEDILIVNSSGASEGVRLYSFLHIASGTQATFTNYKMKVTITKIEVIPNELNSTYVMPSQIPSRNNYMFGGWYTSENGGVVINYNDIFGVPADQTLYAHWVDLDVITPPTISFETNYVSSGLQLLYDGRNNTGSGWDASSPIWKNYVDQTDGILHNNTWDSDNSLSFNGSSSYVLCSSAYHSFYKTLETVFSVNSIGTRHNIIGNAQTGGMQIFVNDIGNIEVDAYIGGSWITNASSMVISTNTIYYVSASYDGNVIKLYINGALDKEHAISGPIKVPESGAKMTLGCDPNASEGCDGYYLNGKIYAARSYSRALTESEILQNYVIDTIYINNYTNINPSITISGGSSNIGVKGYKYSLNNGTISLYSDSNRPVISTVGENYISAYTVNLNNTLSEESTAMIIIDNDNPTVSVNLSYNKNIVTANVNASDGTSEIKHYGYAISDSQTCDSSIIYTYSNINIYSFQISTSGTKYLCVKVTDLASNSTYVSTLIKSSYYPYDENTSYYVYTAPSNGYYYIETWGAQGGTGIYATGGNGSYSSGYTYLNQNEKVYVYVGNQPAFGSSGYNGGGSGGTYTSYKTFGGGGATDIRFFGSSTPSSTDLT